MAAAIALAFTAPAPVLSSTVAWVPDADGFWDVPANWSPGLPGVLSDVLLNVGGPTVRTISFRAGTVSVNSVSSEENLFFTGGDLTVGNTFSNLQETRITGGLLRLNGASSLARFSQTGGVLAGTGVVTVGGAASLNGGTLRGSGRTIIEGLASVGSGTINLDEGRLLEFRGGAVTTGTTARFNLDQALPADGGTLRNALGSTITDATSVTTEYTTSTNLGSFENAGIYRKTGTGTTTVSVAFTNSGTLDLQAGTFRLNRGTTQTGKVELGANAVLDFGTGNFTFLASDFTANPASVVRLGSGNIRFQGAAALPVVQVNPFATPNLVVGDGTTIERLIMSGGSLGSFGTVTIKGDASLAGAIDVGRTIVEGMTTFGPSASDTSGSVSLFSGVVLELRGGARTSAATWGINSFSGTPATALHNAAGSVFVDSTTSSGLIGQFGWGGSFENLGTFRKTGPGTTRINMRLVSEGTLDVDAGTVFLSGINGGSQLNGVVELAPNAVLLFGSGVSNSTTHTLNGNGLSADAASTLGVSGSTLRITGSAALPNLQLQSNGILDLSALSAATSAGRIVHGGAALRLGTNDLTIGVDYQNAAFGAGDSFNARANVTGSGQILAASAGQTLSGAGLTLGASAAPTLDLGNRRVDEVVSRAVTVSNPGNETRLRGAVQGAAAPGVTVLNGSQFVVEAGGTASFQVVGSGTVAGSLAGQSITVANSFANVHDQVVALQGAVYRYAAFQVDSPASATVARVGDTVGSTITIRNVAVADAFSEALGVVGTASGNGASFGSASGLLAPGEARTVQVSFDTMTAGTKTGTLSLAFTSDGAGTSGLPAVDIGLREVDVQARVFAPAVARVAPTIVDFGVVRVGDAVPVRAVTVTNSADAALTDTLVTRLGNAPTGFAVGVAPGPLAAAQGGAIAVGIDTSAAASLAGELAIGFVSRNPALDDLDLDPVAVALRGTVNNLAAPVFTRFGVALAFDATAGGQVFDLGNVIEGQPLALDGFGLANLVTGPADDLSGLVSAPSGGAFSLAGSFQVGHLGAGQSSAPFTIQLDRSAIGSASGVLTFSGVGTNASDPVGLGTSARLLLRAQVSPIPEPGTWALMLAGAALLLAWRRHTPHQGEPA